MSEPKRRRVEEDARSLELCADNLRELGASVGSCQFRKPSTHVSVPLQPSSSASKPRNPVPKSPSIPSQSLYSMVSSAAYAAKSHANNRQDTWPMTLHRLAVDISEQNGSKDAIERCKRLKRRFEAISDTVKLCQQRVRATGDEVAVQDKVESQLAQEETAWEQQMQIREQRVAEREVELQSLKEEKDEELNSQSEHEEEEEQVEIAELQEAVAFRAEEKRDIKAAIDSLQRKKARRQASIVEERKKREAESMDDEADAAAAAAREQVLRQLRDEKETLQRAIIAAEETEESLEENVQDLPALKDELVEAKREKIKVHAQVDSLRLEIARRKRKMRHMVDVQLLTAKDTNPPTLREEAVLLYLLYEHEGEMGVNELKQAASTVLKDHGKPNGNGVVIRALYSLVANGIVQIDRSYGNGLVTSLIV